MIQHKKAVAVLMALLLLLTCAFPAFAVSSGTSSGSTSGSGSSSSSSSSSSGSGSSDSEEDTSPITEITASFSNPNGRVLSVAKNGDYRNYPEDSLVALEASIDMCVDIISVSVQQTKDSQLVLMEDETLDRMLIARDSGSSASGNVSSYSLSELQTNFYLRQGRGGSQSSTTKTTVASLEEAIKETKDHCMLFIANGWQYADAINSLARSADACDTIIIGGATDPSAISSFLEENDSPVCHIAATYKDKTNKTKVKDFTTSALKAGAGMILYETSKSSSAVFKKANTNALKDAGRAMISFTDTDLCGGYRDMQTDWETLIDSGFSVIETDYPKALADYLSMVEDYRSDMTRLITAAQSLNTVNYSRSTKKAINQALEPALELSGIGALSLTKTIEVRYNLQEVMDSIDQTGEASYHAKVKWWVVLLIILGSLLLLAVLTILGLRFFNKRKSAEYKKRQKFKNRFRAQAEANLNEMAERLPEQEDFSEPTSEAEAMAAEALRREQESLSNKLNQKMQASKDALDQKTAARKEQHEARRAERQAAREAARAEKAARLAADEAAAAEAAAAEAEAAVEPFSAPADPTAVPDTPATPFQFINLDEPVSTAQPFLSDTQTMPQTQPQTAADVRASAEADINSILENELPKRQIPTAEPSEPEVLPAAPVAEDEQSVTQS